MQQQRKRKLYFPHSNTDLFLLADVAHDLAASAELHAADLGGHGAHSEPIPAHSSVQLHDSVEHNS